MLPVADRRGASANPPSASVRYPVLIAIFVLWMAAEAVRLVQLQVVRHTEFLSKAQRQQQRTIEVSPKRGVIYDRNFHELARSVSVDSVFAVPVEIPAPKNVAALLARVLGLNEGDLLTRMKASRNFCWVKRKVDRLEAERVRALNLEGIYFQKENKRFYPKRKLAAHVLGYVGVDEVGLAGLEFKLDETIRGRAGKLLIQTDARRRWYGRTERPPEVGQNVVLTLDEKIQYIVERELSAAMTTTRARAGTVVLLDPSNGQILALANRPTFNPNAYAQAPQKAWINRAVAASYEPGSTFKVVTIAAALEERLTRPSEVIDCQMGSIEIAGHTIRDHKPFGPLTVTRILAYSSDVGTIKLGLRLGNDRMYRYIRQFGFGAPTGASLPGEARGLLRPPDRWSKISIGAISMGQEVGVTAMQLITAISAVANDGILNEPRIVQKHFRHSPRQQTALLFAGLRAGTPEPKSRRVLSPETALEMKQMMRQVVLVGTGRKAQLNGWSAAGKTGTAQKTDPATGSYSRTDYVASFVGFAPVNEPAISMVVILDSPRGHYHGGEVAAPVFQRIAEQVLSYLGGARDLPVLPEAEQPEVDAAQVIDFAPQLDLAKASRASASGVRKVSKAGSTVVLDLDQSQVAPEFLGKSVRDVAEQALSLGLAVELRGTGVARQQVPPPGSPLASDTKVTVRFSP